ncbi:MAG TPA: hypothetical protein VMW80_03105 [Candidatus Dormibacteraeota bacterium]|nr:hypothetical protein [Candidatus Dormibacteraeota bacterium]
MTEETTFERINRERRETDQKAEAPNRRYAEVLSRLLQVPRFQATVESPWEAPTVVIQCPKRHRLLEVRLDLTPMNGDPFLRVTPDDSGAPSNGWEGFLSSAGNPVDGDSIVKDKPRLKCSRCTYSGIHTQEHLLGLYALALQTGKKAMRLRD